MAEAVIRVFHERGDYQHKQRNRMKFLIKSIGLGRASAPHSTPRWRRCGPRAGARCRSTRSRPPIEPAPAGPRADAAGGRRDRSPRATARRCAGPGIVPERRTVAARRGGGLRALGRAPTCGRRSRQDLRQRGRHGAARRSERRAVPRPRRSRQCLRRRHGARDRGAGPRVPVGPRTAMCRRSTPGSKPRGSACPTPTRSPTSPVARAPSRASSR